MKPGNVVALHLHTGSEMAPVERLVAIAGKGFEGDKHFGRKTRQALLIHVGDLDFNGYVPGQLHEQITVDFEQLEFLSPGTTIDIEGVELQIEMRCDPCSHMAKLLGEVPEAFKARAAGRRGMLALVRSSGEIMVGAEVRPV